MQGNPQQTVLAYIAGIIDGEESIMITRTHSDRLKDKYRRKTPWYYPRVRVGMTDNRALILIGNLCDELNIKSSVQQERARLDRPTCKLMWRWQITSREHVIKFLETIDPYLLIKKEQSDVLKDFCRNWNRPVAMKFGLDEEELQRREEAFQMMRKLNRVGVAATTEYSGAERLSDSLITDRKAVSAG